MRAPTGAACGAGAPAHAPGPTPGVRRSRRGSRGPPRPPPGAEDRAAEPGDHRVERGAQERELIKLASLAAAVADTLRRRGVSDPAASLTADIAIAVFRTAFERWVDEANRRDLRELIHQSLAEVNALSAAPTPARLASAQA